MASKKHNQLDLFAPVSVNLSPSEKLKANTNKRHEAVREVFRKLYVKDKNGIRPDYEDIIVKVGKETHYSPVKVKKILLQTGRTRGIEI